MFSTWAVLLLFLVLGATSLQWIRNIETMRLSMMRIKPWKYHSIPASERNHASAEKAVALLCSPPFYSLWYWTHSWSSNAYIPRKRVLLLGALHMVHFDCVFNGYFRLTSYSTFGQWPCQGMDIKVTILWGRRGSSRSTMGRHQYR